MRKMKVILLVMTVLVMALSLSACRSRTSKLGEVVVTRPQAQEVVEETPQGAEPETPPEEAPTEQTTQPKPKPAAHSAPEKDGQPQEPADQTPQDDANDGTHHQEAQDGDSDRRDINEQDDSEESSAFQTALNQYNRLLDSNTAALYECEKVFAYAEMPEDFTAATELTPEHRVLLKAGVNNCGEHKQTPVTADWLLRNNPQIIVKFVDLERLIIGPERMARTYLPETAQALLDRDGWDAVTAVQDRRVLLLDVSLLDSDAGRMTASLCIAKLAFPALYSDVDIDAAYREMTGESAKGYYYFCEGDTP